MNIMEQLQYTPASQSMKWLAAASEQHKHSSQQQQHVTRQDMPEVTPTHFLVAWETLKTPHLA